MRYSDNYHRESVEKDIGKWLDPLAGRRQKTMQEDTAFLWEHDIIDCYRTEPVELSLSRSFQTSSPSPAEQSVERLDSISIASYETSDESLPHHGLFVPDSKEGSALRGQHRDIDTTVPEKSLAPSLTDFEIFMAEAEVEDRIQRFMEWQASLNRVHTLTTIGGGPLRRGVAPTPRATPGRRTTTTTAEPKAGTTKRRPRSIGQMIANYIRPFTEARDRVDVRRRVAGTNKRGGKSRG
ncbi:hypothetical protein QBC47DRAFT_397787 [Echria macrotheca]|uniref:Uncharacterized protein n=1 Tax=Echria macrotheca TaxID=438768 RepID=A0AAJ0FD37_9PEZI|nr:hypothetical protein QBC47DRAFT_397787 [Echria macrotheca]